MRAAGVRDLRLVPAAAGGWAMAAALVGVRDAGAAIHGACAGLWVAALVVLAVSRHRRNLASVGLALITMALVGSAVATGAASREPDVVLAAARGSLPIDVTIVVTGPPVDGRVPGTLVEAEGAGGLATPVLLFAERGGDRPATSPGDRVAVRAAAVRAEAGDEVAFLLFARSPARIAEHAGGAPAVASDLRERFARLCATMPGPGAGLLPGLAIGDTSAVDPQLDADMKTGSLSHLTAVSGSNCAVLVGLVFALAAGIGFGRWARAALALLVLCGFVVLVTPQPSVLRAAVMAGIALVALVSSRPGRGIPLLCLAVIALLVADPWLSRSYGFVLSVLATAGLLTLAAPLLRVFARGVPVWLALLLAVPLAAQLACQPVLLMLDPALPLYGVPANVLAEPAAPIATVLGLFACLLASAAPPLAVPVAWLAWVPASWIAAVAKWAADLPGARSPWPTGPLGVALLTLLSLAVVVLVLGVGPVRLRRTAAAALVVSLVAYALTLAGTRLVTDLGRPADWQFAMCDVGQGDAAVVRSGGSIALVDTGPHPEALKRCLQTLGIDRIQLLVLTHYDLDHVGGVEAVVGRADRVLIGPPSDAGDARLSAELAAAGARVDQVERGEHGSLGGLGWRVLWPPPRGVEPGNPASVTLEFEPAAGCRCLSGLFLGDLGEESQDRLLGAEAPRHVDVVKVAHHGSADQSAALYEAVHATAGLIGVGADNDYGHPTEALLGILSAVGTEALRTDIHGLVLIAPGERPAELRVWTER